MLVDTHCHLYLKEFEKDIADYILRAKTNQIEKIYLPAINSETTEQLLLLEKKYPEICMAMMGLHPCYVKENHKEELKKVEELFETRNFVAVGECGLDFYWDSSFSKEQYYALEQQLEWALHYSIPIILHTRNATQQTIDIIKPHIAKGLRGVFHCFGGTLREANEITDMNFYLGIGGVATYKNAGLDKVLKDISIHHIVLETDAPYLSPVPHRGKQNEPSYLKIIAEKLSDIKDCSFEEVSVVTSNNAKKLFSKYQ